MRSYHQLLQKLTENYSNFLVSKEDFKNSLIKNEDGLFLNIYRLIVECQLLVSTCLDEHFRRERVDHIQSQGGFAKASIDSYLEVKEEQQKFLDACMNLIYMQPFQFLRVDESIFSEVLRREMETSLKRKALLSSPCSEHRAIGETWFTSFVKVQEDMQKLKQKKVFEDKLITNQMIVEYLKIFEAAREKNHSSFKKPRQVGSNKPRPIFKIEKDYSLCRKSSSSRGNYFPFNILTIGCSKDQ